MEISNQTTATTQTATSAKNETVISSDFETFLVMLTAQMENQDPLNPLDSQDFATQLATFSGVEQQVKTNDLLAALSSQMAVANLGDMASWVGMEARIAVPASFSGTPIEIVPNPPVFADKAELVVSDQTGAEVQRRKIAASDDPVIWAGVDDTGRPFAPGTYSFSVESYSNGEVIDQHTPDIFATVTEVRNVAGQPVIVLEGGAIYPSGEVTGLR